MNSKIKRNAVELEEFKQTLDLFGKRGWYSETTHQVPFGDTPSLVKLPKNEAQELCGYPSLAGRACLTPRRLLRLLPNFPCCNLIPLPPYESRCGQMPCRAGVAQG